MVGQDGDKWLTAPNRFKTAQPVPAHSHCAEKVPGERMRIKYLTPLYLCIITWNPGHTCMYLGACKYVGMRKSAEICSYFKAKVTFLPMKDIPWLEFRQSSQGQVCISPVLFTFPFIFKDSMVDHTKRECKLLDGTKAEIKPLSLSSCTCNQVSKLQLQSGEDSQYIQRSTIQLNSPESCLTHMLSCNLPVLQWSQGF